MIVRVRDRAEMADEGRGVDAWVEFGSATTISSVIVVSGVEPGMQCLVQDLHGRPWWLPAALFVWPTAENPWPCRWSWAGGDDDAGSPFVLAGPPDIVALGWSAFAGVLDRVPDATAVADRVNRRTALRDQVARKLEDTVGRG